MSTPPYHEQTDTVPLDQQLGDLFPPYTPSPHYPDPILGSGCGREQLCECLTDALAGIEYAINRIADYLGTKQKKTCDDVTACIDEIIKAIDDKYRGIHYTCEQCKSMLQQGMGGTLEFALGCAACDMEECNAQCSLGDTSTEGKCCNTCGESPCCCKEGECVPCGEEKPKDKFVGWCNRDSGTVVVQKEGEPSPGAGFVSVTISEDEQSALADTEAYCAGYKTQPEQPPTAPGLPPTGFVSAYCNIDGYISGTTQQSFEALAPQTFGFAALQTAYARGRAFGYEGINLGSIEDVARAVLQIFQDAPTQIALDAIPRIAPLLGCNNPGFVSAAQIMAVIGIADKATGTNLSQFALPYTYAINSQCRQRQMSPQEAMAAYLGNGINLSHLDGYYGVNGICPEVIAPQIQAAKAKPVPLQLAMMRRREIIDAAGYQSGMRQLGYLEPQVSEDIFKLTEQVPTLSDIIRLMVRDADDEQLANRLDLDNSFDAKYGRQLRKWSEMQGVPELFAKYAWRAHWEIPSPTQLFEFWRRLRNKPEFGGADKLWSDIESALIQQDILPYWHKYYQAVAYHPLGRIDVRRGFNTGALNDDEVVAAYEQLGYDTDNSNRLLKFARILRRDAAASNKAVKLWLKFAIDRNEAFTRMTDDGLPADVVNRALDDSAIQFATSNYAAAFVRGDISRDQLIDKLENWGVDSGTSQRIADLLSVRRIHHPAIEDYAVGTIDRSDAYSQATQDGLYSDSVERLLDKVDRKIKQSEVIACQKGVKKRYILGEFDAQQAQQELEQSGTVPSRASQLVNSWNCEKQRIGKAIPANKLCDWLSRGSIDAAEFRRRLLNIGYDETAADLMMQDCLISISNKRAAQAAKEAKEEAAQSAKAQAAQLKAERLLARIANQQAAAQKAAATARKNREKQLLSAAGKIASTSGLDLYDSRTTARELRDRGIDQFGLNQDESLQALILAVEQWPGDSLDSLQATFDGFAQDASTVTGEVAV